MLTYENRLNHDGPWALRQGSMHIDEKSAVHDALRRMTGKLEALQIPYAVAGGMAMFRHGFRRFTEGVDILVGAEGLRAIHQHLDGLGYIPPLAGSKQVRDVEHGVRIEFLVAGQFPGDGTSRSRWRFPILSTLQRKSMGSSTSASRP